MSPRRKFYLFYPGAIASFYLLAILAFKVHGAFFIGIPILFLVFAFWNAYFFSCPRCGKAYTYDFVGPFIYPTWMPKTCRRCGRSTDIDSRKREDNPSA